jgi:hypothetical protein
MGIVTASGKFANSFFGITAANVAATATSFTVTAKQAQELVRRNGSSSGTCTLVGPPTANGTVVQEVVTFSNVNTTTGVVMCSALTNAFFAGALLGANDGSQVPVTFIPEEWGEFINEDSGDVPFPMIPLDAIVNQTQLTPYPTAVPLREWIKDFLTTKGPYRATLVFTDRF